MALPAGSRTGPARATVRPPGPGWRRLVRWGWLWSALLTATLGGYRLGGPVIWRDELVSLSVAQRPLPRLWHLLTHRDAVSGLYYLVLHGWIAVFGDSLVALRAPSVLAMAVAAAAVAAAGRRLAGGCAGLVAGLLFACLPVVSRYAQEARSYALCVAGAAVAGWLLLRALRRPGWSRWAAYAAATAVAGLAHVVALAALTGHAVVVAACWWRTRDRRLLRWPVAAAAAVLAAGPVLWLGSAQHGGQSRWLSVPGAGQLYRLWPTLAGSFLVAGALLTLAALALAGPWRPLVFGACGVLVPVAVVFLVSQRYLVWYPRYLLFVLPCLVLLAAGATARVPPPAALAVVLMVALLGAADQRAVRAPGAHGAGRYPYPAATPAVRYDRLGARLSAERRPGDARLFLAAEAHVQYDTYLDWRYGDRQPRLVCRAATAAAAGRLTSAAAGDPARCIGHPARLWIVRTGRHTRRPLRGTTPEVATVLRARYRVVSARYLGGCTLILAVRASTGAGHGGTG